MFEHDYKRYPELTNAQLQSMGLSSPHVQIVEDFTADVVKVTDGDTVTLRAPFRDFDFPLRFLDINAPEMSEGGLEAKKWLINRINGKEVLILVDRSNRVGKYGRLLGSVLADGLNVGQEMLMLGYAKKFSNKDEGLIPMTNKYFRSEL